MSSNSNSSQRGQWKSQWGFIMATLGSAIGLGNIWRFSFKAASNGGGAFLIPYLIALLTAGIPLLILEFGIGHERISSAPLAFAKYKKKWEWAGWWAIAFIMFGIELYYSVIISWCMNFFYFAFNLSWGANTKDFFINKFVNATSKPEIVGTIQVDILIGLAIVWITSWFIIYRGVSKGLELANKIFIPSLLILMAILVFWSLSLEGAMEGLKAYFIPDFKELQKPQVWLEAYSQVFFSLSLGFGIMITYASYLPKKSNLTKYALTTVLFDSGFAIFAGIAVFSVLGFMSVTSGTDINVVVKAGGGPGLAFIVYPKALNLMAETISPLVAKIFGAMFFLSLVIAGLSSAISIIEAFVSAVVDKFNWNRKLVVTVVSVIGFFGGIIFTTGGGYYWIDIVDHFLTRYGLVVIGLIECILVGWLFKIKILRYHINQVSTFKLGYWWDWMIKFFVPIILALIIGGAFFDEINERYENFSLFSLLVIGVGWLILTIVIALGLSSMKWTIDIKNHGSRSDVYSEHEID